MEKRVIYVMTHDSIGLGEDGPTPQTCGAFGKLESHSQFKCLQTL
ncbi:MAG: hypothetical protein CM1200mP28_01890 [Deltaproteobacteria bacterium]|nr:MAG: hypothetical protein CM1200mP28_01890 [Deltaproteobacteria bacterium]